MCHELSDCPAATLGAWANRMLCGKCSRESVYSDKPCAHCGNTFAKPGGAHWQVSSSASNPISLTLALAL